MGNNILTVPELKEIWRAGESSFDMMQRAAQIGYEKGRLSQLREDNAELNAVLNVIHAQIEKTGANA